MILHLLLVLNLFIFSANTSLVKTEQGLFKGVDKGDYHIFKGLPYAKPPIDNLRWRAPQTPERHSGIYHANKFPPISLQPAPNLKGLQGADKVIGSEDCLYLNIWAPKNAKNLPVMFWIHGGAYIIGAGAQKIGPVNLYDGEKLVKAGKVIFVSINYRLGPAGFFAHPELAKESRSGSTGNYGLLDQIAALKWVKKHIANFGGDPKNVTIFGESAGGASVFALKASPLAKGLFNNAIAFSGAFLETPMHEALEQGQRISSYFGTENTASPIKNLRKIPMEEIVRSFPLNIHPSNNEAPTTYGYTVDGHVLKKSVLDTFVHGEHNRGNFMLGTAANEMAVLAPLLLQGLPKKMSEQQYIDVLELLLRDSYLVEEAAAYYKNHHFKSYNEALNAIIADSLFHTPAKQLAIAHEAYEEGTTYKYLYSEGIAGHAMELFYLFGKEKLLSLFTLPYKKLFLRPYSSLLTLHQSVSEEKKFGNMFRSLVMRFAISGTPNETRSFSQDPHWPSFSSGYTLELNKNPKLIKDFRGNFTDFFHEYTTVDMPICKKLFN